jgi:Dehydrogenases with different specificities (related to short-chain alcohol dehydrogenases)
MSLNVKSVINLTKNVVTKMLENNILGSIINVSSQMGHVGGPNRTTYCSTKFALEGFTKSLAIELAPNGIRVNSICPTFIKTPMTEPFLKDKDFKNQVLSMIPLGRLGEVEDLMGPFVFLASDASSMMTGSSVLVDGGWTSR